MDAPQYVGLGLLRIDTKLDHEGLIIRFNISSGNRKNLRALESIAFDTLS